jgi:hypothetical protein
MLNKFLLSDKNLFTFLGANHGARSKHKKLFSDVTSFLISGTIIVAKLVCTLFVTVHCFINRHQWNNANVQETAPRAPLVVDVLSATGAVLQWRTQEFCSGGVFNKFS